MDGGERRDALKQRAKVRDDRHIDHRMIMRWLIRRASSIS
jgi:hypothetical protein